MTDVVVQFAMPVVELVQSGLGAIACNTLSRAAALYNTRVLCPAKSVITAYRAPARLFVAGIKQLISTEGTTQGDPLGMYGYALSLQPQICRLEVVSQAKQWWFADDETRCGSLQNIRVLWDELTMLYRILGYYPNTGNKMLACYEFEAC